MYDFTREGFPGFPLGHTIDFYEKKLPDAEMVTYNLPGTSESIRTLRGKIDLEGSEYGSIMCRLGEDDTVSLVEISWADWEEFSFEGLPLAGLSPEELATHMRERGIAAEADSVMVKLPELYVSFFFSEDIPRTVAWQTPEAFLYP